MISCEQIEGQEKRQAHVLKTQEEIDSIKEAQPQIVSENQLEVFSKSNLGLWTEEENLKYIVFLHKNRMKFKCKLKNKKVRLFEQMSEFIQTRTPIQCRTHHQKYENKLGSTQAVVQASKNQIGLQSFRKISRNPDLIRKSLPNQLQDLHHKKKTQLDKKTHKKQIGVQTDQFFLIFPTVFQNNFIFQEDNLQMVLFYP